MVELKKAKDSNQKNERQTNLPDRKSELSVKNSNSKLNFGNMI